MLYEKYEQRISKIANIFKFIFKHIILISIATFAVIAITTTLLATKGIVTETDTCPKEIVYGEKLGISAKAFLSSTYFEYQEDGTNEWTREMPRLPGVYKVRAVSLSTFKNPRYGDVQVFKILPKEITVSVNNEEAVIHGNHPELVADLIDGDSIYCDSFSYEYSHGVPEGGVDDEGDLGNGGVAWIPPDYNDIASDVIPINDYITDYYNVAAIATVTPSITSIKILDASGNDVTHGYSITVESKSVAIAHREITVQTGSASKDYDGTPLTSTDYEILSGSLAFDDKLSIIFDGSITDVGMISNNAIISVLDKNGNDVSRLYQLFSVAGMLTVNYSSLSVSTDSVFKTYDGIPLSFDTLNITEGKLAEGHRIVFDYIPSIKDVGIITNELVFRILDENDNDVTENYKISAEWGTIEIRKRPITISTESASWIYDGAEHSLEDFVISGDGLATNEVLSPLSWTTVKAATDEDGEVNSFDYCIYDNDGNLVSLDNYDITEVFGTLSVTKRPVILTSVGADLVYTGYEYLYPSCEAEELSDTSGLIPTHRVITSDWCGITNAGSIENTFTAVIIDELGVAVTDNYELTLEFGTITVTKRPVTLTTGSHTEIYNGYYYVFTDLTVSETDDLSGIAPDHYLIVDSWASLRDVTPEEGVTNAPEYRILNIYGEEISLDNYDITEEFGRIDIVKRGITATTGSFEFEYSGEPHSYPYIDVGGYGLADGHEISIINSTEITEIGSIDNEIEFVILDIEGIDVTSNYNIDLTLGMLSVVKRRVILSTASDEEVYNGSPLTNGNIVTDPLSPNDLIDGHYAEADIIGTITNVGSVPNAFIEGSVRIFDKDGVDVTEKYDIVCLTGTLTVIPRSITLTTATDSKVYDGTPLTNSGVLTDESSKNPLVNGHYVSLEVFGSITEAGSVANDFNPSELKIFDENDVEVTSNYTVDAIYAGTLTVTRRALTIKTESYTWVYDGTWHSNPGYTITNTSPDEGLAPNQQLVDLSWTEVCDATEDVLNAFYYQIIDSYGNPVSLDNYDITEELGTLTVERRKLTITTGSAEWIYDRAIHYLHEYSITNTASDEGLAPNQQLIPISWKTVLDATEGEINTLSYKIVDSYGDPVLLDNYDITEEFGTLTVFKRKITIATGSYEWVYDGQLHYYPVYTVTNDSPDEGFAPGEYMMIDDWTYVKNATDEAGVPNAITYFFLYDGEKTSKDNYDITEELGTLTIRKRVINVQTGSKDFTYNGYYRDYQELTITSTGEDEGLAPYHYFFIKESTVVKDVEYGKQNIISFAIHDDFDQDVTGNYELYISYGTLSVYPIYLTVQTGSASKLYDATPLSCESFDILSGFIAEPDTANIKGATKITNVGRVDNVFIIYITDPNGVEVTHNYVISYEYGTLEITPLPITIVPEEKEREYTGQPLTSDTIFTAEDSNTLLKGHKLFAKTDGSQTYVGTAVCSIVRDTVRIVDRDGNDVTANYDISYLDSTLTVVKRAITVASGSSKKDYDGTPLTNGEFYVSEDSKFDVVKGEILVAELNASITNAGVCKNEFVAHVLSADGETDLTYNYDITYSYGTLMIVPRSITIVSESAKKYYDGTPLTASGIFIAETSKYKLLAGHEISAYVWGSITKPGITPNYFDLDTVLILNEKGEDVTRNYSVIDYEYGMLEIFMQTEIVVRVESAKRPYDGTPLTNGKYTCEINGAFPTDHSVRVDVIGSITDVGKIKNTAIVTVVDRFGNDVTYDYILTIEDGTLEVTPVYITITTASEAFEYDSYERELIEYAIEGSLAPNQTLVLVDNTVALYAGEYDNVLTFAVIDELGVDQTHNYDIEYSYGKFYVSPRPVSVLTDTHTEVYTSSEIFSDKFRFTSGGVCDNDTVSVQSHSSLIYVGKCRNELELKFTSKDGKDVSFCYDVNYSYGLLRVEKRPVILTSASAVKIYDGTPLTLEEMTTAPGSEYDIGTHDRVIANVYGSITDVGVADNLYDIDTVDIIDRSTGESVISNYEIIGYEVGTLTVTTGAHIVISTESASKWYDGLPLTCDKYTVIVKDGKLPEGATVEVTVTGSIITPGKTPNEAIAVIYDKDGVDISDEFMIEYHPGVLTVNIPVDPDSTGGDSGMLDLSGSSTGRQEGEPDNGKPPVIYTIYSDLGGRIYLKAKSFGDYLGQSNATWNSAPDYYEFISEHVPASYFTAIVLESSGKDAYVLTVIPNGTATLVIPYFAGVSENITITSDAMQGYTVSGEYTLYHYKLDTTGLDISAELAAYEEAYREFVYQNYLTIDSDTLQFMQKIIEEEGFKLNDPNIIQKVAEYIQNAADYKLDYNKGLEYSDNIVIDFLAIYGEGVCRHYAAAATMLYRALGIPARYTVGFVADAKAGDYTDVTAQMAHAWVEVYLDGLGWIPVEVTGSISDGDHVIEGDDQEGDKDEDDENENEDETEGDEDEDENTEHPHTAIVITPEYQCKEYDGTPLYASGNIIINDVLQDFLNAGYTYKVKITGSRTEIGVGTSRIESFSIYNSKNEDVTDELEIVYESGTLEVTYSIIEIYLAPMQKYYDGKPLTLGSVLDVDYIIIDLPVGLKLNIDIHVTMTDAGILTADQINADMSRYISYSAYLGDEDVSDICRVVVADIMGESDYAVLEITRPTINLRSYDATKTYDGTPLTNPTCHLISGNIPDGFSITYYATGEALEVGDSVRNTIVCTITDENGNDVTDNFDVRTECGQLTVTDSAD